MSTSTVDTELEDERNRSMLQATTLLAESLEANGDVPPAVLKQCTASFNKATANLDKKMETDFKKEIERTFLLLTTKNKVIQ